MTLRADNEHLLLYPLFSNRIRLGSGLRERSMYSNHAREACDPFPERELGFASPGARHVGDGGAIVAMWMAVLFVGVYGGDMTFHGADTSWSNIPSGVAVALFAAIGTVSVAKRVFGRKSA